MIEKDAGTAGNYMLTKIENVKYRLEEKAMLRYLDVYQLRN